MTITAEADPQTGWVHVRATGRVSRADVTAHLKDLATRGLYGRPRLVDARGSTISINRDEWLEVVILVRQLQIRWGMSSVALVPPDDTAYDLVRTNSGFGGSIDPVMQVFQDPEGAANWLRGRHTSTQPPSPPG
jgi:hypothetical protein